MERLTEWTGYEWIPTIERRNGKMVGHKSCMRQLAAYEDTGLTPEEIVDLNTFDGSQAVRATAKLQEEQRKHKWIPVSERLPEYDGMYLACFDDGFVTAVAYETGMDGAQEWELWADSGEVIAWMRLPEPYKEVNHDKG